MNGQLVSQVNKSIGIRDDNPIFDGNTIRDLKSLGFLFPLLIRMC